MGLDIPGGRARPPAEVMQRLADAGVAATVMMIDGQLVPPNAPLPAAWRDVRLRGAEGTVTLVLRGDAMAVVVFGNADAALRTLQEKIAAALAGA